MKKRDQRCEVSVRDSRAEVLPATQRLAARARILLRVDAAAENVQRLDRIDDTLLARHRGKPRTPPRLTAELTASPVLTNVSPCEHTNACT